jgi:hypothetical protein
MDAFSPFPTRKVTTISGIRQNSHRDSRVKIRQFYCTLHSTGALLPEMASFLALAISYKPSSALAPLYIFPLGTFTAGPDRSPFMYLTQN